MKAQRVVAIALLTKADLADFGYNLRTVMRPPDDRDFDELLQRLNQAESKRQGGEG